MRGLILNLHLAIALIAGLFMVVLGATGSIIAFEPEIDRLLHPGISYVDPSGRVLSLVAIGDAVSRKYPGEPIVAYLLSDSPQYPARVITSRGIVSVDQYTGQVLGLRTRGQSFLGIVRALHTRLAAGDVGRNILRWSAVAMLFSLVSGLYLWWPAKRARIRRPWWRGAFWFDLHNAVGVFSLLPLLVLAGTGTVIGFEDQFVFLVEQLGGSTRAQASRNFPRSAPVAGSVQITPDQAVTIASAELPGAVPYRVQMPQFGGFYVVALAYADNRIASGRNSISVDSWSGQIVAKSLATDLSRGERILAGNEMIHTGSIFGMSGRIVAALTGLLLLVQAASGFVIWLRRIKVSRPN